MLSKYGLNNTLSYRVIAVTSLGENPPCKNLFLFFTGALDQCCIERAEVFHSSDFFESLLDLVVVTTAPG